MSCNCKKVMVFLRQIGATHAAEMHENLGKPWTSRDWLLHMAEEENLLWPILINTGHGFVVEELDRDHAVFRWEIRVHGEIVSKRLLEQHARVEDETIECILRHRR
jgi:uncharacterized protein (UPF0128 family)